MGARLGYDISVQYGANQPEYDLAIIKGDRLIKVSVKGSKDGGWGLTQSNLTKADSENENTKANYHGAIDIWFGELVECGAKNNSSRARIATKCYIATLYIETDYCIQTFTNQTFELIVWIDLIVGYIKQLINSNIQLNRNFQSLIKSQLMVQYQSKEMPFLGLPNKKNLSELINYIEEELKIKGIKCYLKKGEPNQLKNRVERISIECISNDIVYLYREDIIKRTTTILEEKTYDLADTNIGRYHCIAKQLLRVSKLLDFYLNKNPLNYFLSDLVTEVRGEIECPSNFYALMLKKKDCMIINSEFETRYNIVRIIYELILKVLLDFDDIIHENSINYGWKPTKISDKSNSNPGYEIYELAFALVKSDKLTFYNGKNMENFIDEFLNFFNLPPNNKSDFKSRLTNRKQRFAPFLDELIQNLAAHIKPIDKKRELIHSKESKVKK